MEQKKLCFKIEVPQKENRISAREDAYSLLIEKAETSGLKVIRPQRMGNGTFMTVLQLKDDYRVQQYENGVLDMEKTIEQLMKARQILNETFLPSYS